MNVEGGTNNRSVNIQPPQHIMFNFEKLETCHEAIAFADLVYQFTRKFPDESVLV